MILGLPTNLVTSSIQPCWDPDCWTCASTLFGGGITLWYDFNDTNYMYVERDSNTTFVANNNDKVGRVHNKACHMNTHQMGAFVYALSDITRPQWKTGGANNKSYIKFDDGSSNLKVLITRSTDLTTGGIMTDGLSGVTFQPATNGISIFIVATSSTTGAAEPLFSVDGGEKNSEEIKRTITLAKNASTNALDFKMTYEGESDETIAGDAGSVINADASIHAVITDAGSNASKIYKNGTEVAEGTIANDANIEFLPIGHPSNEMASLAIGGVNDTDGVPTGAWNGGIYEVLIFNKTLDLTERTELTSHLKSKYSIT